MNIFDIIGPVMIGPSSSHTAGACLSWDGGHQGHEQRKAPGRDGGTVRFLARTYRAMAPTGHCWPACWLPQLFLRNPQHLQDCGPGRRYLPLHSKGYPQHPSQYGPDHGDRCERHQMHGTGGQHRRRQHPGGLHQRHERWDFTHEHNTILVPHYDRPGVIAAVTNIMWQKYKDVNIGNLLSCPVKGGIAMMTIEIDGMPPAGMIDDIRSVQNVTNVILIRAI